MELWELADLATPWCVHVAATLRVADYLTAGPKTARELAAACGADASALARVIRQLVEKGVFEEPSPGTFALNDMGRKFLAPGARESLDLNGFGGRMAGAWATLPSAVRTGRAAYHEVFGLPYWEDLAAHPEIAEQFDVCMGPGHGAPDPEVLVNPADWAAVRSVVDVGGGTGMLLAAIQRARPGVKCILVDMPRTVARAVEEVRENAVAQSFFDPLPPGADVYLMKNVLCDWPDEESLRLLTRCAEAAGRNGRVVVLGGITLEDRASPELLMLVLVGGKSRTLAEFGELAGRAGLRVTATGRQPSGRLIVECRA
jgi:hypothetical protein